uniref:Uncharacterized protein n=1 Tax=uncultured prokaryote TaxID=198431 RepID=A0A0H5Q7M3_9ZZZZ|nr:hypothetical protein [uncultured prokaryote]
MSSKQRMPQRVGYGGIRLVGEDFLITCRLEVQVDGGRWQGVGRVLQMRVPVELLLTDDSLQDGADWLQKDLERRLAHENRALDVPLFG